MNQPIPLPFDDMLLKKVSKEATSTLNYPPPPLTKQESNRETYSKNIDEKFMQVIQSLAFSGGGGGGGCREGGGGRGGRGCP